MLKKAILKKSAEFLSLSAYTTDSVSFFNGKAGILLTIFRLADHLKDEIIERHAVNLLQEILVYNISCNNFQYGKAGISFFGVKNKLCIF